MRSLPHLDIKEHLRVWRRHVLPLFTVIGVILLLIFIVIRSGQQGPLLPGEGLVPARVGLLDTTGEPSFDPAFATLSPTEMVLAPPVVSFTDPINPLASLESESGTMIHAVADGLVIFAGTMKGKETVILAHRYEGALLETIYSGLDHLRVSVGSLVRRGQTIGILVEGNRDHFHFEHRSFPALALEGITRGEDKLPEAWRGRPEDRLSAPLTGEFLRSPVTIDASTKPSTP